MCTSFARVSCYPINCCIRRRFSSYNIAVQSRNEQACNTLCAFVIISVPIWTSTPYEPSISAPPGCVRRTCHVLTSKPTIEAWEMKRIRAQDLRGRRPLSSSSAVNDARSKADLILEAVRTLLRCVEYVFSGYIRKKGSSPCECNPIRLIVLHPAALILNRYTLNNLHEYRGSK